MGCTPVEEIVEDESGFVMMGCTVFEGTVEV